MEKLSEKSIRQTIDSLKKSKELYIDESNKGFNDDRDHLGFKKAMSAEKEDRRARFLEFCLENKFELFTSRVSGCVTMKLMTRDMSSTELCTVAMKGAIQFGMSGKWYHYSENVFQSLLLSRAVNCKIII